MRLNTRCSIALHCLVFIAEYENKTKVTSELLAKSTGCNPAAIRSVLSALQKEGIISIVRGVGGAHLNDTPQNITAWMVCQAVEQDALDHLIGYHPSPSNVCPVGKRIRPVLEKSFQGVGIAVRKAMEEITLQQLLDHYRAIE